MGEDNAIPEIDEFKYSTLLNNINYRFSINNPLINSVVQSDAVEQIDGNSDDSSDQLDQLDFKEMFKTNVLSNHIDRALRCRLGGRDEKETRSDYQEDDIQMFPTILEQCMRCSLDPGHKTVLIIHCLSFLMHLIRLNSGHPHSK